MLYRPFFFFFSSNLASVGLLFSFSTRALGDLSKRRKWKVREQAGYFRGVNRVKWYYSVVGQPEMKIRSFAQFLAAMGLSGL